MKYRFVRHWAAPLILCVALVTGCSSKGSEPHYLVRVNDQVVTVDQFKRAVDAAGEEAFPGEQDVSISVLRDLRMRVLNQLSEELIIAAHAKVIGVTVSKAEVDEAVNAIKADYPDNTFEETLLENAVSFDTWRQKLATRMLVDKVVKKEIVDQVQITSDDVAGYIRTHFPDGAPAGERADAAHQKIVRHLRHEKAEVQYPGWIESMRAKYPVQINQEMWNRLADSK